MRKVLAVAVLVCGWAWPSISDAAPIVNGSGILTGATGVNVSGTLYDVTFVDGTCQSLFSPCTAPSNGFDFSSAATAIAAVQALDTQVFTGAFDTAPNLTFGCTSVTSCIVVVPYEVLGPSVLLAYFQNNLPGPPDAVGTGTLTPLYDTGRDIQIVYADFTPSAVTPVPEPASILLLGSGLAGTIATARRRRKRQNVD